MITLAEQGVYVVDNKTIIDKDDTEQLTSLLGTLPKESEARKNTIAWNILQAHNRSQDTEKLRLFFDAMASHDITYVGIIQTARASGMKYFPLPYVLTCCHNSLCAVGGTINDDDHLFGLSAAKKYGGIYVPPHLAVIHQFMREKLAGCGKMILGSDSHTRYGALGTLAIGEGGGELVKQLLQDSYDITYPQVVAVYLSGRPPACVGPLDVALAIIGAVYKRGYVKNKIMEFIGDGIANLSCEFRCGIDVMTTETACLSSIWRTDDKTKAWLAKHGRENEYKELIEGKLCYYDGCVTVDLSKIEPMVALPFHPSNVYSIAALYENLEDILYETQKSAGASTQQKTQLSLLDKITPDGRLAVQQGIIAGCAGGTFSNICEASALLADRPCGNDEFYLSVYPASQPIFADLVRKGKIATLMDAGALVKTAFCGPCFGAGDIPANNTLSLRHVTRNFPNREGSKPSEGQAAAVILADARSIAATSACGGKLTSAAQFDCWGDIPNYDYDESCYKARVYNGFNKADPKEKLRFGPNIKDWPVFEPLANSLLLKLVAKISDELTTTDELIPSGETSSYRSNPLRLAEFTLSRRLPEYVGRAKAVAKLEQMRLAGEMPQEIKRICAVLEENDVFEDGDGAQIEIGSVLYAKRPGDGSAREQAASCQRVLGGLANISYEYATKRYRSNCINWGILPFQLAGKPDMLEVGDYIYVPDIVKALDSCLTEIPVYVVSNGQLCPLHLSLGKMTQTERDILKAGCLINYNRARLKENR